MNESFGSNQQTNQPPAQPMGWSPATTPATPAPAQPAASPAPAPVASSPFESSPIPNITGPTSAPADMGPVMMEPAGPKSSAWLYVILAVLVIGGLIFLSAWMNWIPYGKILGLTKTQPTPTATPSPTETPIVNNHDAARKNDLVNLKTALKKYYNDKQSYPISTAMSKTSDPGTPLKVLVPTYLPSLPLDPLSPNSFYGYKSIDGKSFSLTAALEDQTDQSCVVTGSFCLYTVTDLSSETPSTINPLPTTMPTTSPSISIVPSPTPITTPSITTSTNTSTDTSSSGDASSSADASATVN